MSGPRGPVRLLVPLLVPLLVLWAGCRASEFPERECCDPIYPIPEPTSRMLTMPTPIGKSGSSKTVAILNCLYARKLCFEHPSCSAILEIIPRVCGPELVACSTVTMTKCQAALKSLQAFEFFKPTCLCREPHVDPECNSFRDFLFDHPCIYVMKKEKDPYSIEALPTCNQALSVCQRGKPCVKLYDDFKTNCKTRDGKCRMENRDACHEAWTQLRLSPMFGCICPDNGAKKRCDRIFSMVNHNPCVESLPSSASVDLAGTDSALYPFEPHEDTNLQEIWLSPTSIYPYFLFPGTAGPQLSSAYYELDLDLASNLEQQQLHHFQHGDGASAPDYIAGRPKIFLYPHSVPPELQDSSSAIRVYQNNRWETQWLHFGPDPRLTRQPNPDSSPTRRPYLSTPSVLTGSRHPPEHDHEPIGTTFTEHKRQHANGHDATSHQHRHHNQHHNQHRHHLNQPVRDRNPPPPPPPPRPPRPGAQPQPPALALPPALSTPTTVDERTLDQHRHGRRKFVAPRPTFERVEQEVGGLDKFRMGRLPVDRLIKLREAFEGFVDSVNVISNADNTTTHELIESQVENPLIDANHQDLHALKQLPIPSVHHHRVHHRQKNQSHEDHEGSAGVSPLPDNEGIVQQPPKVILTSTCHHAYTNCKNDPVCKELLEPVLNHCDYTECARNECMAALQSFYKMATHKHSIQIAFCLCRKSDATREECMLAQEKLHPVCAQRVAFGLEIPNCDTLAQTCREDVVCRSKLEHYEQSCAVDSVTKKCAGPSQGCRTAVLGILGTELRSNCACKGTDTAPLYECLGWQRLLWVNPCVVEAQKDYHTRRFNRHHGHGRTTIMTSSSSGQSTPMGQPSSGMVTPQASLVSATDLGLAEAEELVPIEDEQPVRGLEDKPNAASKETVQSTVVETASKTTSTAASTTTTTTTTTGIPTILDSSPTALVTTGPTTPSTTTVSTPPPRFCVVQRPRQSHQYIREGKGKRLYREDEPECSELCQCGEGEILTCNTICVELSPCKTDFAFYNHAAPAYQAYRGRCLCYSGRFICMRPSPDAYNIPHGVFMFLGYSETDENLLKSHNNLTVVDAVSSLDNFMREEVNNQTICTLFLYNITKENVIAVARLMTDNTSTGNVTQMQTLQYLLRVKEECASMLQDLSDKINNHHQEVHTHPLLSIFKMAEVEIKLPPASGVSAQLLSSGSWFGLPLAGLAAIFSIVLGSLTSS